MLVDIFITYKDREDLFKQSLESLYDCTKRDQFRLTVICDGGGIPSFLNNFFPDHVLVHKDNMGLGPSINQALSHIDALNLYYGSELAKDLSKTSELVCYSQDDLLYSKDWLEVLVQSFFIYEWKKIGFASGVECVEHPVKEKLPNIGSHKALLKDWIRAAQMMARRSYWMSMYPIPRWDPETKNIRAKPNNGIGSGVDWWFIRNHENSVCKTGRSCLVLPGLVKHLGYNKSTWLDRELPESDSDKRVINQYGK